MIFFVVPAPVDTTRGVRATETRAITDAFAIEEQGFLGEYAAFLGSVFRGDLGESYRTREDVTSILPRTVPVALGVAALYARMVRASTLETLQEDFVRTGRAKGLERVFHLPGIGTQLTISLRGRDLPVILGVTLFVSTVILVLTLLADLAYGALDPRIRDANRRRQRLV